MSGEFGKARTAQHKDLSKAFGGLLTRNEPTMPASTIENEDATVAAAVEAIQAEAPATEPASSFEVEPKRPARSKAKASTEGVAAVSRVVPSADAAPEQASAPELISDEKADQPVQISLPVSLYARLTAFKKENGLSHPNILFDAIENTAEKLAELVRAKTVQLGSTTGATLFSRPQTAVKREAVSEPKESFIIRITKQNKSVLDNLAEQVEAPNRMVLIVAAYDAYLPELLTE